jgi:hypothetical protein
MTGRIIKYSEPVPFHKAMPGSISIPIMKRYDDGIPEGFTPPKRKKIPKVRNARNEPIDDEVGKPAEKGITMSDYDYDNSRGPWHAMIDKRALAIQAQIGCSYAQAFTKAYTDPKNAAIVEQYKYDDLAKAYDALDGGQRSASNTGADIRKRVDELTLEKQARDREEITGETFAAAYTAIYTAPENIALRKAAPADPQQDFVSRGAAHQQLHEMALEHSRTHGLSYAQSYTRLFTSPENVALRAGIAAEAGIRTLTIEEAQALEPAKEFPAYGDIGDTNYKVPNMGTSGKKPRNYAGG